MSERHTLEARWPWQVTAALWLFLADIAGLYLTSAKLASETNAADSALDPTGLGGGYLTAANLVLSTGFMAIVVVACLSALALVAIVWTCRGWTRHLMALSSTVFFIMAVILGGMPNGFPVYAMCCGLVTLLAASLVYTDASQKWFERPKLSVYQPVMAAAEGFELAVPAACLPRADRPVAVSLAAGCMVGFLTLMFIGWSWGKSSDMAPGESYFFFLFDLTVVLVLALIPYGLWHGVPVARRIATPFCLISGFLLLFYIWGPDLLNCMMLVLAIGCVILLHWRGVRAWFLAAPSKF